MNAALYREQILERLAIAATHVAHSTKPEFSSLLVFDTLRRLPNM